MMLKSSKKQLDLCQTLKKKRLISKNKRLTIDIPDADVPSSLDFNKNSPKHWNHPKLGKTLARPKTQTSTDLAKKIYAGSPKPKAFLFPPDAKVTARSTNKLLKPKPKLMSTLKPKTPVVKKMKPKIIKRPKTSYSPQGQLKPETGCSPTVAGLNSFVTQVQTKKSIDHEEIYNEHLFQTFQALKIVKSLPPVDLEQLKSKRILVPRRAGYENKKTLVFDLDETLVHCCENPEEQHPDVILPVTFPNGEVINAGINIRPHALECLRTVNKDFEVFVFTASHQCYANVVLDYLDPTGELIHARFFRDNCINMGGIYIKDLRIFANRKLNDVVIVDNAAYSFAYQIDNGIPIISWHDDREDRELLNLTDYLQSLVDADDIREVNFETFHLKTFYEDYMHEFLLNNEVANESN
jgi:Dullard-like phosphatase family protein